MNAPSPTQELEMLFPGQIVVTATVDEQTHTFTIKPIRWKQTAAVLKMLDRLDFSSLLPKRPEPIVAEDGSVTMPPAEESVKVDPATVLQFISSHSDLVTDALVVLLDTKKEIVESLDLAQMVEVVAAVVKVNADFFTTQVLPKLAGVMAKIGIQQENSAGPKSQ